MGLGVQCVKGTVVQSCPGRHIHSRSLAHHSLTQSSCQSWRLFHSRCPEQVCRFSSVSPLYLSMFRYTDTYRCAAVAHSSRYSNELCRLVAQMWAGLSRTAQVGCAIWDCVGASVIFARRRNCLMTPDKDVSLNDALNPVLNPQHCRVSFLF